MQRRDFIAAAGAGTLAALAGCTGALGAVAAPDVPTEQLESGGWVQRNEFQETVFERSLGPVTLTAKSHTLVYEDRELRQSLREKTLGNVDARVALFSATRVVFSPNLADLPGDVATPTIVDQTASAARTQFESQMREAGLENVRRVDTGTMTVDSGAEARLSTFQAEFPFEGVSFPVTEETTVTLPGSTLTVAGELAVWSQEGSVLVAGGAYPAENLTETVTERLSSAITVTVDVDLGLKPARYRDEVRSLIGAVG